MTNWIDEAQQNANTQKRYKEELERTTLPKKELELLEFHKLTDKTKKEIQIFLNEAMKQGLVVSEPHEGYREIYGNHLGDVGKFWRWTNATPNGDGASGEPINAYAIIWKLTEPKTGQDTEVCLGIDHAPYMESKTHKRQFLFWEWEETEFITNYQQPLRASTTVFAIEAQLKAWLFKIFSEQN